MNRSETLLEVQGISRRFGGLQALQDVSFEVRRGEILALIGPNGAGKSTLLNLVTGFIAPDAGQVRFKGRSLIGLRASAVSRLGLARSFQAAEVLPDLSVGENVMAAGVAASGSGVLAGLFGRTASALQRLREQALRQLDRVGLAHLADTPASLLTAGQQRLVAAARALATGAELLLLDEPAAGLNTREKAELADAVLRIRDAGTTVVFVEHDLGFVGRLAERMVVLNYGRVIAQGPAAAVRQDPQVLAAYLGDTELAGSPQRLGHPTGPPLLQVQDLSVRYGALSALAGMTLEVRQGEVVALVGANGAGKSTLLKAVVGAVSPHQGRVLFGGDDLAPVPMPERTGLGIALAPEGRALFAPLSVRDNLMIGRYAQVGRGGLLQLLRPHGRIAVDTEAVLDEVLQLFPRLRERIDQQAGTLSGGEAQMLAIGRALMSRPRLLLLDEPSFGLAPKVSREILEALPGLAARGLSVLMVEQNARSALQVADRAYVVANGGLVAQGRSRDLERSPEIAEAYLGFGSGTDAATAPRTEDVA